MPDVYQPDTPRTRGDRATPHISDAPHISPATMAEDAHTTMVSRISWGAVLAGRHLLAATPLDGSPAFRGSRLQAGMV